MRDGRRPPTRGMHTAGFCSRNEHGGPCHHHGDDRCHHCRRGLYACRRDAAGGRAPLPAWRVRATPPSASCGKGAACTLIPDWSRVECLRTRRPAPSITGDDAWRGAAPVQHPSSGADCVRVRRHPHGERALRRVWSEWGGGTAVASGAATVCRRGGTRGARRDASRAAPSTGAGLPPRLGARTGISPATCRRGPVGRVDVSRRLWRKG